MNTAGKVVVAGAGAWGKNLVRQFAELGALSGVAESAAPLREAVRAQYPTLPLYDDFAAALQSDAQAVVLATPVPTHFALAKAALEAGKDVFVEKPMTMTADEGRALCTLAEANGRVLMVGHLLLYQPAIRWIAHFLKENGVGAVRCISQSRLNFGRARTAENALWSLGVHDVAVMLALFEETPTKVEAWGKGWLRAEVEDDVRVRLSFASGREAFLHSSWLWPEKRRELTVVGSDAMLVFDELARTVTLHKKKISDSHQHNDGGSEVVFRQEEEPLRLEAEYFLARLADRARPLSDGRQGVAVIEVLEAANRSLQSGRGESV